MNIRRPFVWLLAVLTASAALIGVEDGRAQSCAAPCVGPQRGVIMAAGGGPLSDRIYGEFVRLAGGTSARIVVIPTAGDRYGSLDGWSAVERLRALGVERIEILHTRRSAVANLAAFSAPLARADGVWISGGRQWRLVDVYLNTRTHDALRSVLERGGVIAGNSAGASALASFLIRGAETGDVVVSPDRDTGLGLLRGVAIDQHLVARGREQDLIGVLDLRPDLLGIGLEEGSAIVVTGDVARVVGEPVVIYDLTDPTVLIPMRWLDPGDVYDLGSRRLVFDDLDAGPPPLVIPLVIP